MEALQAALVAFTMVANAQVTPTMPRMLEHYSKEYKIEQRTLERLMMCESGGNPLAVNPKDPNGGSKGLFQYQPQTWKEFNRQADFFDEPDIWNPDHQIQITAWALSKGLGYHWSCWKYANEI